MPEMKQIVRIEKHVQLVSNKAQIII